ncbi:Bug family tripartite tricarboxylate transporter substrate binding protein [Comamonas resistens]|uniref:Tripartite tricarboxylate transporter substrate binding protein n=1 Tax=Comamonas resistens TaxID=3046670 RepID=A0ABY8SR48_9BURK|nr:tripartite tricarboxylate transporter substrate binding protein [Comamonas resistens]MDL5037266.1 tripartite tricarboxylate transporter substrate binding protein [Comamonas resistens]WHS65403.1 tripartite tricarboxylate transporter substrate binding protein [Comamonas resistens]
MQRSAFLKSCLALACSAALSAAMSPAYAAGAAEQLSSGQFTIIAPFPAGGAVDILSRILATGLTEEYKQAAIVDNRPGANGNIGIDMVKRAKPDGHTLLVVPQGNLTINPTLMPKLPYNVFGDFVPVASMGRAANVIVVNPQVPAKTIQELVALSKSKPDSISYASPGVGSSLHLAGELFKDKSGADIMHVAYKGSGQGLNDALGGTIPMLIANMPTVLPHVQSGKLRALAVTDATRSGFLPNVPTLAEAGIPGIAVSSWYGVLAPKNTPPEVVKQLAEDIDKVMKTQAAQNQLKSQGMTPWVVKGDAFGELIRKETALWAPVVKSHHIVAQ